MRLFALVTLTLTLVACPKPPPPKTPDEEPEVEVEEMPPLDELLQRGVRQLEARELKAARKSVDGILVMHANHLEARVLLAMVAEAETDAKQAAEAWTEVERILVYQGKLKPFQLQQTLFAASRYYTEADRFDRGRLFLDELWRRFPTGEWSVKAQLMLAESQAARKRWTQVTKVCSVLNRLRPSHSAVKRCHRLSIAARRMLNVGPNPSPTANNWIWEHPLPQGNGLNDIWVASDGTVFVVGDAGTILRGDRRKVTRMKSNTRWSLRAVWGSAPNSVYAVGAAGVVVRYDGKRWKVLRAPRPTEPDLFGVFTANPGQMAAVGDQGVALRLENGKWITERLASVVLRGVWGSSGDNLYAVGDGGILYHFFGGKWRTIRSDSYEDLWGVWGPTGAENIFVVGNRKTVVNIKDNTAKERVVGRGNFRDTWGFNAKAVWAVGTRGEVIRFDGRSWRNESTGCLTDLLGVGGRSPQDLWAVGDGGTLLRRKGKKWRIAAGGLRQELVGIALGPAVGEGYALGRRGMLLRRDRKGRWKQQASLPLLGTYRDIWSNGGRAIAVGERGLMVQRVGRKWQPIKTDTPEDLLSVWGYDGGAVAVGTRGTIVRLVGDKVIRDRPPTGLDLRDVWGDGRSLIAVGNRGTVLRFDGDTWTDLETGTLSDLHGVWGLSPKHVVAVGEAGTVLVWKNGRFTTQASPVSQTILDVWGSAADALFAVSGQGTIIRYDGKTWQVDRSPAACLRAISGDPATGVLAVGCHGTVVRWSP